MHMTGEPLSFGLPAQRAEAVMNWELDCTADLLSAHVQGILRLGLTPVGLSGDFVSGIGVSLQIG